MPHDQRAMHTTAADITASAEPVTYRRYTIVTTHLAELVGGCAWHWWMCSLSWWWRNAVRLGKILIISLQQTYPSIHDEYSTVNCHYRMTQQKRRVFFPSARLQPIQAILSIPSPYSPTYQGNANVHSYIKLIVHNCCTVQLLTHHHHCSMWLIILCMQWFQHLNLSTYFSHFHFTTTATTVLLLRLLFLKLVMTSFLTYYAQDFLIYPVVYFFALIFSSDVLQYTKLANHQFLCNNSDFHKYGKACYCTDLPAFMKPWHQKGIRFQAQKVRIKQPMNSKHGKTGLLCDNGSYALWSYVSLGNLSVTHVPLIS